MRTDFEKGRNEWGKRENNDELWETDNEEDLKTGERKERTGVILKGKQKEYVGNERNL